MDNNIYLDLLQKDLDKANGITVDSIDSLLGHMTNLHNTVGKSYEYLLEVMSGLVKAASHNQANDQAQKNLRGYEEQVNELKAKIMSLEQELERARERNLQLQRASEKKDESIQELENQLEKANEKIKANTRKDFTMFKLSADKELSKDDKSNDDNSSLKRKYDEISRPALQMLGVEEEDIEGSRSSTKSKDIFGGEDSNNFDDFKFKKVFKKVKRNENSREGKSSKEDENVTNTPVFLAFNSKKSNDIKVTKPSQSINFDEDGSLQDLLNNFVGTKDTSSKNMFNKSTAATKTNEKSISSPLPMEKLAPKSDSDEDLLLSALSDTRVYKKGAGAVAFSQKSPLKGLELPSESDNATSIPITRGNRFGNNSNLMQRMLMGNKKRNSTEPNHMFKMSSQRNPKESSEPKTKPIIDDADLVRESHRSKREREGLQGFGCDQCDKFYNHIADGIHIKSAADVTNRCSRHRDKFPLPSTPEKFHDNFSLNTQD